MILLNPLGLFALLAIPAVIIIHLLQKKAEHLPISTLFLLQKTQRESLSGQRLDRLMHSIPLWLQLLIILLITWVLVQPRYTKASSTQRIAIVLDSSASMSAFKAELVETIKEIIPTLQGNAQHAELWLFLSDTSKPRLYQGSSITDLITATQQWQPNTGAIEPSHSIRIARSLAGKEGAVVYITDTPRESLPYNAHLYSIGSTKDNVGFTGINIATKGNQLIWKTLVRNYSDTQASHTWYLENEQGQRTQEKTITIEPRKIISLQGRFPEGSNTLKLVLSPDAFPRDNILPIIKPQPKTITIHSSDDTTLTALAESMQLSFPNVIISKSTENADISLASTASATNTIIFNQTSTSQKPYLTGNIVAEKHPLIDGLNWQSLIAKRVTPIKAQHADEVLLWQNDTPLVLLRSLPNKKRNLIFNLDLNHSNFLKLEAAVVLLLRFTESIRAQQLSYQQVNTEASQILDLASPPISPQSPLTLERTTLQNPKTTAVSYPRMQTLYAPDMPCFFTIKHSNKPLMAAANHFADTREADFSACAKTYIPASTNAAAVNLHTTEDRFWRYWVLLALFAILASWHYARSS